MTIPDHLPIRRQEYITGHEIEDLREAVGWDRMDGCYDHILSHTYTHFSLRDGLRLVAFVNVISDGLADAFLIDLMVHPDYQNQGIGIQIVQHTIQALCEDGIRCIQVIFEPHLESFYRACGFTILQAGIIDTWNLPGINAV